LAERIAADVSRANVAAATVVDTGGYPEVHLGFGDARRAAAVYRALAHGTPPVIVSEELLAQGTLVIAVATLHEAQGAAVCEALRRAASTLARA
jgi:hypothetical protein